MTNYVINSGEKFGYSPHDGGTTIWGHDDRGNIITMDTKGSMICLTTGCNRAGYGLDPRDKNTLLSSV